MSDRPVRPRRGRHVEAQRNDWLVLDAAREVFASEGPDASIAAVAERAGVGIGSLYRRYGSKAELLRELCVLAMEQSLQAATDALQADEAWEGLAGFVRASVEFRSGALSALAGAFETTPQMWELSERGRAAVDRVVARAHRKGVLRTGATSLDVMWLIELLSRRAAASTDPEDANVSERLLTITLDGLRGPQSQKLPGKRPSEDHYVRRWVYRGPPSR